MSLDMVRLTDSPTYRSLCEAVPTDPSAVLALVDRLQDCDAGLADVLVLFAGSAPEYMDGLPQAVLVEWLKATEKATEKALLPVHMLPLIWRWEAVRAVSVKKYWIERAERNEFGHRVRCSDIDAIAADVDNRSEGIYNWNHLRYECRVAWNCVPAARPERAVVVAVARARRWIKRQVLALFPEVVCVENLLEISLNMSEQDIKYATREVEKQIKSWPRHVKVNAFIDQDSRRAVYRQTIHAPDLIQPEPSFDQRRYPSA